MRNKKKQGGWIVTTEIVVLLTCLLCTVIIACAAFGSALIGEFGDLGGAIGSLNQTYTLTGVAVGHPNDPNHPTDLASWAGSFYIDTQDFCDQGSGVRVCVAPTPEAP